MRKTVPCSSMVLLFLALSLISPNTQAQSLTFGDGRFEAGAGLGPLFFLGDLGGNHGVGTRFIKDVNLPLTKMQKGIFIQYYFKEWLGVRIAANTGLLEGDDAVINSKGGYEESRKIRNLNFRSKVNEAYLAFEISPTVFFERYDGLAGKLRPYLIGGIGVFNFNPQGKYYKPDGTYSWVDLHPLRLEGQGMSEYPDRKKYELTQMMIPLGFGVKYYFNENLFFGVEVLHRKTFTDYIDDVSTNYIDPSMFGIYLTPEQAAMATQLNYRENFSPAGALARGPSNVGDQRGNPKQNDSYFSTILRMGWRFDAGDGGYSRAERRANRGSNRNAMRQMRCPSYY